MHDQESRFFQTGVYLFLNELLVVAKKLRGEDNVACLVNTVYVAEGRCNGKHRADL